jgi:peroxiredoxin
VEVALIVALVASWVFALVLAFLLYGLMRQHAEAGQTLRELSSNLAEVRTLLQQSAALPVLAPTRPQPGAPTLPVGAPAPGFALPDLAGQTRTLHDFLGEPLLLVFWDPQCGFCDQLAPRFATLPQSTRLLLVSRRAPQETVRMAERYNLHCDIVVEPDWQVASSYGTTGTPTGYLIDAHGRIASELAIGADALLALAA